MATGAPKGNINIFGIDSAEDKKSSDVPGEASQRHLIEDEKEDEKEDVSLDFREMKLEGDEATIMYHFFRNKDLKTIGEQYSGLITRSPLNGYVKFLMIRYKKKYTEDVTKHIVNMRLQMKKLQRKDFSFKVENSSKLVKFLEQPERLEDPVCYISDIGKSMVEIIGQSYEAISAADHKLKIYLGEVKATGIRRQGRKTSDSEIEFDSSTNQTASYADVTKNKSGMTAAGDKSRFVRSFSSSTSSTYGSSFDDDFSFQATLNNGFVLKVYKASITKLEVDVIVNAANENMMHGGGVARVISEAAGWELDNESADYVRQNGNLNVAENIVTTAGKLRQYRGVIHAVGPVWYQYRDKMICLDDLGDCVYNVLETCQKKGYRTVAMSAISAGIFAVPKVLCADMYVDAAARFSKNLEAGDCPRELHIIDIDTSILKLVEASVKKWKKDPQSINARITLPKFLEENPHLAGHSSSNSDGFHGRHRGQRHQGHGGGGQGQRRDRENNTSQNFTGQTSASAGGGSNKHNLTKTLALEKEERFRWGGRAKVYKMDEKVTVKIFKGEINKAQNMDAVVCSMDKDFSCTGFIASTLRTTGGSDYIKSFGKMEKAERTFTRKGSVFKCKAGSLGVHHVMHVVMDKLKDANPEETKLYQGHIYTILNKADEWEFPKLVIPLFGTGLIQTNEGKLKACCIAVLKGIDDYLDDSRDKGKVTDIHLVNNNDLVNKTLVEVFDEAVNLASTFGNKSLQESHGGNRKQNENGSGRRYQESGGGYSGRRQNESKNDGRSPNRYKENWERFEDDPNKDGTDRNRQGKKQFKNSHRESGAASESSDKTHSSGQSVRGAAGNTATPESHSNDESDDEPKRPPVTPQKEEKPAGGNLMIIEN